MLPMLPMLPLLKFALLLGLRDFEMLPKMLPQMLLFLRRFLATSLWFFFIMVKDFNL